jgi:hypothetical protein
MQANELSMAQKQEAVDLASSLPPSEAQQLQQLLRLAAGFGVGALLARFFGARGFLLTTFGGLGGAFVASQLRRSSTDRFGQPLQTGRDWQGKAF